MGKIKKSTRQEKGTLVKCLTRETHFSKQEVEWLLGLFYQLAGDNAKQNPEVLDRGDFVSFLFKQFGMTDSLMTERVFRSFNTKNDNKLCQVQFVKGMSVVLRGTLDERMKFAFCVYDFNSDGYITKEEIFGLAKPFFVIQDTKVMADEDPEEGTKELVDIVMKKIDKDSDFRISLADYTESIPQDELMLECLGPCLPDGENKDNFLAAMSRNELPLIYRN